MSRLARSRVDRVAQPRTTPGSPEQSSSTAWAVPGVRAENAPHDARDLELAAHDADVAAGRPGVHTRRSARGRSGRGRWRRRRGPGPPRPRRRRPSAPARRRCSPPTSTGRAPTRGSKTFEPPSQFAASCGRLGGRVPLPQPRLARRRGRGGGAERRDLARASVGRTFGVTQVVTGGPEGDVYVPPRRRSTAARLRVGPGAVGGRAVRPGLGYRRRRGEPGTVNAQERVPARPNRRSWATNAGWSTPRRCSPCWTKVLGPVREVTRYA